MKQLWDNYRSTLFSVFPDLEYRETWARWEAKGTSLIAKTYSTDYFIKAREVDIWSDKSCIYNNIIYPKTGSNLPCFGMDLMGFFEKKIIIVFDFQHPKEKYPFSGEGLPKSAHYYKYHEEEILKDIEEYVSGTYQGHYTCLLYTSPSPRD